MKKILLLLVAAVTLIATPAAAFAFPAEADAAGVQAPEAEPVVKVVHSGFEVHNPLSASVVVEVYALTGRCVRSIEAPTGVTSYSLPAGHYILRVAGKATKIVIK